MYNPVFFGWKEISACAKLMAKIIREFCVSPKHRFWFENKDISKKIETNIRRKSSLFKNKQLKSKPYEMRAVWFRFVFLKTWRTVDKDAWGENFIVVSAIAGRRISTIRVIKFDRESFFMVYLFCSNFGKVRFFSFELFFSYKVLDELNSSSLIQQSHTTGWWEVQPSFFLCGRNFAVSKTLSKFFFFCEESIGTFQVASLWTNDSAWKKKKKTLIA